MLARCARCQNNFTTETFGLQRCPHCGSELLLSDPNAPPPAAPQTASPAGTGMATSAQPAEPAGGSGALPPPPPPPPGGGPGGFGTPPGGGPPPGPEGELPAPFAERDRLGFFHAYIETFKLVATKPQEFFRRVRIDRSGSAVLFGLVSAVVGNAISALYSWAGAQQATLAMRQMMDRLPADQRQAFEQMVPWFSGHGVLWTALFAPIWAIVSIYVAAGILHLLLLLFRGANRRFDATLTTVGYAYGLTILLAVPACGSLIALVWYIVALIIGTAESQRCGTGKAAAAVLLPGVLLCCCCAGAGVLGLAGAMKAIGGVTKGGPVDL